MLRDLWESNRDKLIEIILYQLVYPSSLSTNTDTEVTSVLLHQYDAIHLEPISIWLGRMTVGSRQYISQAVVS